MSSSLSPIGVFHFLVSTGPEWLALQEGFGVGFIRPFYLVPISPGWWLSTPVASRVRSFSCVAYR